MKTLRTASILLALFLTTAASAADPDPMFADLMAKGPEALLAEADKRHNPFDDQTIEVKLQNAGEDRVLQFITITKGDKRAIAFSQPADLKGMGVVISGSDEIYVKVPGARKVRRVGTHAKRQSFQGTAWSMDEMAIVHFSHDFAPAVKDESDTHVTLELTRKEGSEVGYDKLIITVEKAYILVDSIEYYDEGTLVKRQTRSNPTEMEAGHVLYKGNIMEDIASNTRTETEVIEENINTGVKDSTFGKRWLIRSL